MYGISVTKVERKHRYCFFFFFKPGRGHTLDFVQSGLAEGCAKYEVGVCVCVCVSVHAVTHRFY